MIFVYLLFLCVCYGCCDAYYDQPEGAPCVDKDRRNGTCTNIKRCIAAAKIVVARNNPLICSFDGLDPIICCTDCDRENYISNVIQGPFGGIHLKSGQKAFDECIQYMVDLDYSCNRYGGLIRIWSPGRKCYGYTENRRPQATHGGIDAIRDEFPHMALLGYGPDLDSAQWLCGGSVISEKYILTAGHCISSPKFGPVTYVAMGILKRTDPPELWQRYKVQRIIPHPDYNSPSKYHDIALLETEQRIYFSKTVLPVCLDTGINDDESQAWATGWGALGHKQQLADNLQSVLLKRYDETTCSAHYPPNRLLLNGYDHEKQMCFGNQDKDTCEGDSGGPLQVRLAQAECMFVAVGVTSYGKPCGFDGNSGIYTKISYYIPWIESIVWP